MNKCRQKIKKLNVLRRKLDKLDNKLIDIIKVRTNLVKEVVKLKEYKKEIVDKKRISIILKKLKKSISKNIDPKITTRIWKNMIWSYINYERKVFKKIIYLLCAVISFQQTLHAFLLRDYIFWL